MSGVMMPSSNFKLIKLHPYTLTKLYTFTFEEKSRSRQLNKNICIYNAYINSFVRHGDGIVFITILCTEVASKNVDGPN